MSELFSGIMVIGWSIFIFNYFRKKHLNGKADLQVKLDSDPKFKEEYEKKMNRYQQMQKEINPTIEGMESNLPSWVKEKMSDPRIMAKMDSDPVFREKIHNLTYQGERIRCEYLGGYYADADSKGGEIRFSREGMLFFSGLFTKEKAFLIPWNEVVEVSEVIEKSEGMSNMGNLAQGFGLMSAGQGGLRQGVAANALITASTTMKSTKQDDFLYLQYYCDGVKGMAMFKFDKSFFNKRPAAQAISIINKYRIQFKLQVGNNEQGAGLKAIENAETKITDPTSSAQIQDQQKAISQSNNISVADEITKLRKLKDDGSISEEEFNNMKTILIKKSA